MTVAGLGEADRVGTGAEVTGCLPWNNADLRTWALCDLLYLCFVLHAK